MVYTKTSEMCIRDRNITNNNVDRVPGTSLQDMGSYTRFFYAKRNISILLIYNGE